MSHRPVWRDVLESEIRDLTAQLHANQHADTVDLASMMADRDTERARADMLEGQVGRLRDWIDTLEEDKRMLDDHRDFDDDLRWDRIRMDYPECRALHPDDLDDAPAAEGAER